MAVHARPLPRQRQAKSASSAMPTSPNTSLPTPPTAARGPSRTYSGGAEPAAAKSRPDIPGLDYSLIANQRRRGGLWVGGAPSAAPQSEGQPARSLANQQVIE